MNSEPHDAPDLALAPIRDSDAGELLRLAARKDQNVHEPGFPELPQAVTKARLGDREPAAAGLLLQPIHRELAARPRERFEDLEPEVLQGHLAKKGLVR